MLHEIGKIVIEDINPNKVSSKQDELVTYHGYKQGEGWYATNTELFNYVLVISDDHYADVEYRFRATGKILSRSEMIETLKAVS